MWKNGTMLRLEFPNLAKFCMLWWANAQKLMICKKIVIDPVTDDNDSTERINNLGHAKNHIKMKCNLQI